MGLDRAATKRRIAPGCEANVRGGVAAILQMVALRIATCNPLSLASPGRMLDIGR